MNPAGTRLLPLAFALAALGATTALIRPAHAGPQGGLHNAKKPPRPVIPAATPPYIPAMDASLPPPRLPAEYLPVPLVPQAYSYSCGDASLMAVLEYWNKYDEPETDLFKALHTTEKDGTNEYFIAQVAKTAYGLRSELRKGLNLDDLRDALRDGTTVILDIQAWADNPVSDWRKEWEDGHYVVLVAMDANYGYFMDPSGHGAYTYLPLLELLDRWHDYDGEQPHPKPFYNLGIFIHGSKAKTQYPGELIRMM